MANPVTENTDGKRLVVTLKTFSVSATTAEPDAVDTMYLLPFCRRSVKCYPPPAGKPLIVLQRFTNLVHRVAVVRTEIRFRYQARVSTRTLLCLSTIRV